MIPYLDRIVTLYEKATKPEPLDYISFGEFLDGVRGGKRSCQALIEEIRAIADKDRRDRRKKQLYAVSVSGRFSYRNNDCLDEHSGLVQLDVDKVEDPHALKKELEQHPNVVACFLSPSGTGVKVIVAIDPLPTNNAEHRQAFEQVAQHFGLKDLDDGVKAVSVLYYYSYDPEVYVNPDAEAIRVSFTKAPARAPAPGAGQDTIPKGTQHSTLVSYAGSMRARGMSQGACMAALLHENENRLEEPAPDKNIGRIVGDVWRYGVEEHTTAESIVRRALKDLYDAGVIDLPGGNKDSASAVNAAVAVSAAPVLEWVPFPTDALPPAVGAYVVAAALALGCDEAMIGAPSLAVMAGAVGNYARVQVKRSWEEPGTVWVVVIARSGSKKSPAMAKAVAPVYELERRAKEDFEQRKSEYEENQELPKDKRLDVPNPKQRRYRIGDTTLEAVARVHSENARGLLLARDEGAGWIGSFDRYATGEADSQGWCEMYEGRILQVDRKSADHVLYIVNPAVSVATTIQPRVAEARFPSKLFDTGFPQRIIFTEPPERRRQWTDADISHEAKDAYFALIEKLYALEMIDDDPHSLGMETEARNLYKQFYNENAALMQLLPDGPLRSAFSKIEAHPLRLALSLHLADYVARDPDAWPGHVSRDAMQRAIIIVRWIRYETTRVYLLHGWHEMQITADERLLQKLTEPFTVDDIAAVWGVKRRAAYEVIKRLLLNNSIEKSDTSGQYRVGDQCTLHLLHSLHFLRKLIEKVQSVQSVHCASTINLPEVSTNDHTPKAPALIETDASPDVRIPQQTQSHPGSKIDAGDTVSFMRGSANYTGKITESHPTQAGGAVLHVETPEGKTFDVLERDVRCRSP